MGVWSFGRQRRSLSVFCRGVLGYAASKGAGSRFALYHGPSPLLCPEDGGPGAAGRGVWSHGRRASDGSEHRPSKRGSAPHPERPAPNRARWTNSPAGRIPPKGRGVSPELQKLGWEDFAAEWEKPARRNVAKEAKGDTDWEVVYGVSPCLLALRQGRRRAVRLLVKEGGVSHRASLLQVCEEARRHGVQVDRVSKKHLDGIAPGRVHQGVCLLASPLGYLPGAEACRPSGRGGPAPLWLVLDGIQDPMNLGSILRTSYFLGVDRVASSIRNSCPLTPAVSKASSGTMEIVKVYGYESLEDLVGLKAAQGWQVVGTVAAEAEGGQRPVPVTLCSDFQVTGPTLLLLGGEGEGLSQTLLSRCQTLLTIPPGRDLLPGVESLNVSVATGILLHSLLSSRGAGHR